MAEWRYYEGEDEPLSGCQLELDEFVIYVNPNQPPYGFSYRISWRSHGVAYSPFVPTREKAQKSALEKLMSLTREWYTQAFQAHADLIDRPKKQLSSDQH